MLYYEFNKFISPHEMAIQLIVVNSYFDGENYLAKGPYTIALRDGVISEITRGDHSTSGVDIRRAVFLMPGMTEAHCHLFLNGAELNSAKRSEHLSASKEEMLKVGRKSVAQSLSAGITMLRDAGDIHGINLQLRREFKFQRAPQPTIRCAGKAIRKASCYGSFMAQEVMDCIDIEDVTSEVATEADEIKVLMTGLVDFEAGDVTGEPQFSLEEARRIAHIASGFGRSTFAHCNGVVGIDIAIAAGMNSIEHGYFITRRQLQAMAEEKIAWVPTFSPLHFQKLRPELVGWSASTVKNLEQILENHGQALDYAYQIGVEVLVGSDAGSIGVEHGHSYIGELKLMAKSGVSLLKILRSATVLPRRVWNCRPVDIVAGSTAEILLLDGSPFEDIGALQHVVAVYKDDWYEPRNIVAA